MGLSRRIDQRLPVMLAAVGFVTSLVLGGIVVPARPKRGYTAVQAGILAVLAATNAFATGSVESTAEAGLGMCAGSLTYGLEATGFDHGVGRRITVGSDLEWPSTATIAQATWRLSLPAGQRRRYGARLFLLGSLDAPHGAMKDSDWAAPAGRPDQNARFSYIETELSGRMLLADLGLWLTLDPARHEGGDNHWILVAGYRHEYVSALAYNMRGWQWFSHRRMPLVVIDGRPRIALRSQMMLPYVGARWQHARAAGLLSSNVELRTGPAFADVDDDHLTRRKVLEGNAVGWALSVRSEPRVHIAGGWHAGLDLEWQLVRADWGALREHFYGDDPFLSDDQTGQSLPPVSFYSRSLRYTAALVVGLEMR